MLGTTCACAPAWWPRGCRWCRARRSPAGPSPPPAGCNQSTSHVPCHMSCHHMSHITTRGTWHVKHDNLLLLVELSKIFRDIFTINVQKTHNRPSDCGLLWIFFFRSTALLTTRDTWHVTLHCTWHVTLHVTLTCGRCPGWSWAARSPRRAPARAAAAPRSWTAGCSCWRPPPAPAPGPSRTARHNTWHGYPSALLLTVYRLYCKNFKCSLKNIVKF